MTVEDEMALSTCCWEGPLEKEMATHSSVLAWKNPMGKGAWLATVCGITESYMIERLNTLFL